MCARAERARLALGQQSGSDLRFAWTAAVIVQTLPPRLRISDPASSGQLAVQTLPLWVRVVTLGSEDPPSRSLSRHPPRFSATTRSRTHTRSAPWTGAGPARKRGPAAI